MFPSQPQAAPPKPAMRPRPAPAAQVVRPRPAPVARGQMADEPRAQPPLAPMPTPEQLGVAVPKPVSLIDLRIRLDRLGASGFQLAHKPDGWHFACQLPNGRTVESMGSSETDAIERVLMQVEPR